MRETATRGDLLYLECLQAAFATQGIPRQKSNSKTLARGEYVFAGSVSQIVHVLNRHDWRDGARRFELRNRDVRNADRTRSAFLETVCLSGSLKVSVAEILAIHVDRQATDYDSR